MNVDDGSSWEYKPDGEKTVDEPELGSRGSARAARPKKTVPEAVEWTASEYIEHSRSANWYAGLVLVTALLAFVVWFLTNRDYFAVGITIMTGLSVAVFATNKPKEITYQLTPEGLIAGAKLYPYSHFKSFAIIREGGLNSVNLIPIKRFVPPISAYYEAGDEEKIIDVLGQYLAYEERGLDRVERLSRRLRL